MRIVVALLALLAMAGAAYADPWRPAAGATEIALWPNGLRIERPEVTGPEAVKPVDRLVGGQPWLYVKNVTRPTMTIYSPQGTNTGAAVMVFPGGGYNILAIDLEGTEACDWLTSRGITCVLLKYRVPGGGPNWNAHCNCRRIPRVPMALQDAQRAMGLLRQRAISLGVDPHKIGVLGFSAGGHLVAAVSNTPARTYARVDAADDLSSVPDFAMALYPGHLWANADDPDKAPPSDLTLASDIHVSAQTPPTFIVMAEDDHVDGVRMALAYYVALRAVDAPVEMHLYAHVGHAFGLRRTDAAITGWPTLAERWMQGLGVLPAR
ncbi:MAG: alpha/beta hydrolase [Pseudomonadota bacterium]